MYFIIFGNSNYYKNQIDKLMMNNDIQYEVLFNQIIDKGIYVIEGSLDIVKKIRNKDGVSPIVYVSDKKRDFYIEKLLKIMVCNKKELLVTLKDIIDIFYKNNKEVIIKYKGELFIIPFDNIMYLEKIKGDNKTKIVLDKKEIIVPRSIKELEKVLDKRFVRTHRSCVINFENIKCIDYDLGYIFIGEKKVELISRKGRKELIKRFNSVI